MKNTDIIIYLKSKKRYIIILGILLCVVVLAGNILKTNDSVKTSGNTKNTATVLVKIPDGSGLTQVADILKEEEIINSSLLFKVFVKSKGLSTKIRAGDHNLKYGMDYSEIIKAITAPPKVVKVTIPEGYSVFQIAKKMSQINQVSEDEFSNKANDRNYNFRYINQIPTRDGFLEGYLFPDTYVFPPTVGEKEIIQEMLKNFELKFNEKYQTRLKQINMTLDKVIILASIVEREAKEDSDRKKIAGVFYNRLNSKEKYLKKLQSCATVQYILLKRYGEIKETLLNEDTRIDDPYNTYIHEGLPPGPICSPGIKSIEAALYPEKSKYYYFVARKDGSHIFSRTLKEHAIAIKNANKK